MMMLSINKTLSDLLELEQKINQVEKILEEQGVEIDTTSLLQKYFDDYFII